jgi:hypothetical protein
MAASKGVNQCDVTVLTVVVQLQPAAVVYHHEAWQSN